jgi:hypothetical protein
MVRLYCCTLDGIRALCCEHISTLVMVLPRRILISARRALLRLLHRISYGLWRNMLLGLAYLKLSASWLDLLCVVSWAFQPSSSNPSLLWVLIFMTRESKPNFEQPLVIASGLSVGKEGPSVHMACCIGSVIANLFPRFSRSQGQSVRYLPYMPMAV